MPDMMPTREVRRYDWENAGTIAAGKRIRVMLDGAALLDVTVPVGKAFRGTINVQGEIIDA